MGSIGLIPPRYMTSINQCYTFNFWLCKHIQLRSSWQPLTRWKDTT